jgi:hypothetical protein
LTKPDAKRQSSVTKSRGCLTSFEESSGLRKKKSGFRYQK